MGVVDKQTSSRMMAGIGSKDTKPALAVRRYLHRLGFRFDLHVSKLPGKPDILLSKRRAIIFLQGCFGIATRIVGTPLHRALTWGSGQRSFLQTLRVTLEIQLPYAIRDGEYFSFWKCGLRRKPVEKALE